MNQIDEWTPVYPKQVAPSPAPAPGGPARPPSHQAPPAADLVRRIQHRLQALESAPAAVHFYLGEGLRWIRVGFDDVLLQAADVEIVGKAIQAGIGNRKDTLYFHALRPYDLLFFMEHADPDATGMPPQDYGAPLDDVLAAWWPKPA